MKHNLETIYMLTKLWQSALLRTKMLWFVAFSSFCSVRTLAMARLTLPLGCQWLWSWKDTCTTGSCEGPSKLSAAHPCRCEDNVRITQRLSHISFHLCPSSLTLHYGRMDCMALRGHNTYSKLAQLPMIVTVHRGEEQSWEWEGMSVST